MKDVTQKEFEDLKTNAEDLVTQAHKGQFRKNSGVPYVEHVKAVAKYAEGLLMEHIYRYEGRAATLRELLSIYIVGLGHDLLEDTKVTYEEIELEFGGDIALLIGMLTKKKGESYLTAILRAKSRLFTRLTKIADNTHNMSDLQEGTLKDKYRLSKYILENQ